MRRHIIQSDFIYASIKEIERCLGGDLGLSSEKRTNSSEVLFRPSVGIISSLRGDHFVPPEGFENFHVDILDFQSRNRKVPLLELKSSSAGTKEFPPWN